MENIIQQFHQAMLDAGIDCDRSKIVPDGELHRMHVRGAKGGTRDLAYTLHLDGQPAGYFEDHKGVKHKWRAEGDFKPLTAEELKVQAASKAQREAERQVKATHAASKAATIYQDSEPAPPHHPYLITKRIKPHHLKLARNGQLIVPMVDDRGEIVNVQFINTQGRKRFLAGAKKKGNFAKIEGEEPVLICEGFATGASLHEHTGCTVVVAMDAGNLTPVAEQFPGSVICGDNDKSGVGQKAAEAATRASRGRYLIPPTPGYDWNDELSQEGASVSLEAAIDPLTDEERALEDINSSSLELPCFIARDDDFSLDGRTYRGGVYYCGMSNGKIPILEVKRICSPLYVEAITNTESGDFFGRLLRFRDTLGRWREWGMPMEMLRGSGEDLRGELLASGVEIAQKGRTKLIDYLQFNTPERVVTAATRTGWTNDRKSFVLRDHVIGGSDVHFQNESIGISGVARVGGDCAKWREMIGYCEGNPILLVSVCVALAGPLLALVHRDSGGVHWMGDSSTGKSTSLAVATSVWGDSGFKRTWRSTANGLEGAAAMLSDTCLCLDEISEADPREIGAIVYSLSNGMGKTRANRLGAAREAHQWRLTVLSTGERSIAAAMSEGGRAAKSGQLVRFLSIPAARRFGCFDNLHEFKDGRQFADYFKTQAEQHYGYAGVKFVEYLLTQSDIGERLTKIEGGFSHGNGQEGRAADRFAVYALAGELAIEAGILPWAKGSALAACQTMYDTWLNERGEGGLTEERQILESVSDYILKYGDTRFTDRDTDMPPKTYRSGWYDHDEKTYERTYLFTADALKEAGGNYDPKRILDALFGAGWIAKNDPGKRSKVTTIRRESHRLYWIKIKTFDDWELGVDEQTKASAESRAEARFNEFLNDPIFN